MNKVKIAALVLFVIFLTMLIVPFFAVAAEPPCPKNQACLSWQPVTADVDGIAITEPVTYRIYLGSSTQLLIETSNINAIVDIVPGNNCFTLAANTAIRGESSRSAEACKSYTPGKPAGTVLTVR